MNRLRPVYVTSGILAVLGLVIFAVWGRWAGVIGFLCGVGSASLVIYSWHLLIALSSKDEHKKRYTSLTVIFVLLKLPIFGLAAVLSVRQGLWGWSSFLAGIGLVYSALVWGALRWREPDDARS